MSKPLHPILLLFFAFIIFSGTVSHGQGLHFSQYYNTPTFLNPANTALMPQANYRVGVNYRNQWSNIPAQFRTMDVYAEFQTIKNETNNNWLGIGAGFFSDKAGYGDLARSNFQLSLAYHLHLDENNMISFGMYGSRVQRSVNFSKLTFDNQWDGFSFNSSNATGELNYVQKTNYWDIGLGLNYSYMPNDELYFKLGGGIQHLNRPVESFYNYDNKIGMRPTANADLVYMINSKLMFNPSAYYSYQKGASEAVFGSQFNINVSPTEFQDNPYVLTLGGYYRVNESIIPMVGLEWSRTKLTVSYDITVSKASKLTSGAGAIEASLIFTGFYSGNHAGGADKSGFACPRF